VRRSNLTTERAIEWVSEGKVDVASYATHRFPLGNAADAMELALAKTDGVIRAIVAVGG
jgi:threonine dehydrogenase-like Zn-dependent dehydrogenase